MTITKEFLSGSTNGRNVKLVPTGTPGTLLHTATAVAGAKDELFVYLTNTSATEVVATIEFGGVTSPDDHQKFKVPANDTILAISGLVIAGGLLVRGFAAVANVINASGYVNRIS